MLREQDQMGVESHAKALAAQASGKFAAEVVPVTLEDGTVVSADEGPREGTSLERLAKLKPVFKEGGSVTAGTSSQVSGIEPPSGAHSAWWAGYAGEDIADSRIESAE